MNKKILVETIGWYGMAAILLAYILVSFKVIASDSATFQLLNLTGALGVAVISIRQKAKQPAALNLVWAVVALVALVQLAIR